jgi:hypothetical protein
VWGHRPAAFAVSYFTRDRTWREPLQVYLLHRRESVPAGQAAASVLLEKAIEMLLNSGVLAACVLAIARLQLVPRAVVGWLGAAALALLLLPLAALVVAWAGARPIAGVLRRLPESWMSRPKWRPLAAAALEAEGEMLSSAGSRGHGPCLAFSWSAEVSAGGTGWLPSWAWSWRLQTLAVVGAQLSLPPFRGAGAGSQPMIVLSG